MFAKNNRTRRHFICNTGDATVDKMLIEIYSDVKNIQDGNKTFYNTSIALIGEDENLKAYIHYVKTSMERDVFFAADKEQEFNVFQEGTACFPYYYSLFISVVSLVASTACYSGFSKKILANSLPEDILKFLTISKDYENKLYIENGSYKEFEKAKHDILNHYYKIAFNEKILRNFINYEKTTSRFYVEALCSGINKIFSNNYELVCHRCYWWFSDINTLEDIARFTDRCINDCSDKEFQLGLAMLFIKAITFGMTDRREKFTKLLDSYGKDTFSELLDYTNTDGNIGRYLACIPNYHPILSDFSCSLTDLINVGKEYISPLNENETTDNTSTESHTHQSNSFNIPDNFFQSEDNLACNINSRIIREELQGKDKFAKVIEKIANLLVNNEFFDDTPAVRNSFIIAITGRYLDKGVSFEKVKLNKPAAANNICYIVKSLCQKPKYKCLGELFIPYQDDFKWESNNADRNILEMLKNIIAPYKKKQNVYTKKNYDFTPVHFLQE